MKITCLVSLSTTTKILVYPDDNGKCSMKSMEIEFQGFSGMGSCRRLPEGLCLGVLDLAQVVQDLQ